MTDQPCKPGTAPDVLRLAPADNVVVAVRRLERGQRVGTLLLREDIEIGHKIAACDIAAGQRVLKWGCPIGSAKRAIAAGEHVHTHNLGSDYLPTFTLDDGQRFVEQH